jgi:hypothetical protein
MRLSTDGVCIKLLTLLKSRVLHAKSLCPFGFTIRGGGFAGRDANLPSPPQQPSRVEFEEFRVALAKLPSGQCEALLLVGALGFSYEEAAAICESAVDTVIAVNAFF